MVLLALTAAGAAAARYIANEAETLPKSKVPDHPPLQVADAGDPWTESLRSGAYWRHQPSDPARSASGRRRPAKDEAQPRRSEATQRGQDRTPSTVVYAASSLRMRSGATYRTVCVRLCDGYFWPISFATTAANFARDAKTCRASCNAPAALYYYPNPGGEPKDMMDLAGQPYTALGKAFLYRTRYDAGCKCRPHPWEPEAIERQAQYVEAAPPDDGAAETGRQ